MKIRKAKLVDAKGIAHVHMDSWLATYRGIVPDTYLDQISYGAREELWNDNLKAKITLWQKMMKVILSDLQMAAKRERGSTQN